MFDYVSMVRGKSTVVSRRWMVLLGAYQDFRGTEDRGNKLHRNTGNHLLDYMPSKPRRLHRQFRHGQNPKPHVVHVSAFHRELSTATEIGACQHHWDWRSRTLTVLAWMKSLTCHYHKWLLSLRYNVLASLKLFLSERILNILYYKV